MTQMRNLTHDFVRRTKANLETIERLASQAPNDHFEVTQLVNSCVGLLFVPTEDQLQRLNQIEVEAFLGDVSPPKILFGDLKYNNAAGLIRYLRNAFAHLNFDFEYANNKISGLYVWNVGEDKKINWVAYVRQADLRGLLIRLSEHYLTVIPVSEINTSRLYRVEETLGKALRLTNPTAR